MTTETDQPTVEEPALEEPAEKPRPRWRRVISWALTAVAALLVLFALVGPNELDRLGVLAFLRVPIEGLAVAGLMLVLPGRARRVAAVLIGVLLGLLIIIKLADMGFTAVLDRPFDPVLDWAFFQFGLEFLSLSVGKAGAIAAAVGAAVLALVLLALMPLAVLRLARQVTAHRRTSTRAVIVLGVVWVSCAVLGVRIGDGPVASHDAATIARDRVVMIGAGIADQRAFAEQAAVDAFRDTPGSKLLTGLRGKDVILAFVESYGRVALDDPEFGPQVGAMLDAGSQRLRAAGFASRSAYLTSSTAGGGSWLAHSTLLSGLWVDNQQRYRTLVTSDRLTLNGAFQRAQWRTVGVMPAITRAWPEGDFYGYDHVYTAHNSGYQGPPFFYATMPDQYTLAALQRNERAGTDRAPVMAEIAMLSSHTPFAPVPPLLDWNTIGDGTVYNGMPASLEHPEDIWDDRDKSRAAYAHSIEYSVSSLISFMENYGDDNLVLIFLGDHQPAPMITGDGASRDVPITIVARDPAIFDRIADWNWHDGLKPAANSPTWRMDTFRDRFLTTFGPQPPDDNH
ncbi:MAG TPA: sulfatase [Actinophytocola sp.]|uniref:sulfatase n=1 Tax=Actinophytocola sp. TaxID=1872138 RepID=UPI002DB694A2|nr:sulfatase [Actinophytocola sp.]HEU5470746.1 sulfatase [Actinophytocola sp.]